MDQVFGLVVIDKKIKAYSEDIDSILLAEYESDEEAKAVLETIIKVSRNAEIHDYQLPKHYIKKRRLVKKKEGSNENL